MENPSIKSFLLAPIFLLLEKFNLPFCAGKQPLGVEMHKGLWGAQGPSGMGTIKPENQGGLIPSGTIADVEHKAGLGAAAGWPFLPGASACGITAQRLEVGGRNMLIPGLPPQIGTDSLNTPIQPRNSGFEGLLDSRHPVTSWTCEEAQ